MKREKYEKLLDEHYTRAKSTIWGSWYDSEIRDWLAQHGYVKNNFQANRDEVSALLDDIGTCSLSAHQHYQRQIQGRDFRPLPCLA